MPHLALCDKVLFEMVVVMRLEERWRHSEIGKS